jgi:hypothetical protein
MSNESVCSRVVSRMVAALVNATDAGERVFESREAAFTRNEMPCIVVAQPENEDTKVFGDGVDENTALITVSVLVRAEPWRQAADRLAIDVHRLLQRDSELQAMVVDMRKTGRKWESEEADMTAGCDTITYRLIYLSSSDDITNSI